MNREVEKKYLAILRGWTKEEETIDYDLTNENEIVQNAITYYRRLQISEIDLPFLKHPTSRYSYVISDSTENLYFCPMLEILYQDDYLIAIKR